MAETEEAKPAKERKRLQLEFSPEAFEWLRAIVQKSGTDSNVKTVKNALRFYEWYLDKKSEGSAIFTETNGQMREIEFVFDNDPRKQEVKS